MDVSDWDIEEPWRDPRIVPGKHLPECDSQLGPEFALGEGEVRMTITLCTGCLPTS